MRDPIGADCGHFLFPQAEVPTGEAATKLLVATYQYF